MKKIVIWNIFDLYFCKNIFKIIFNLTVFILFLEILVVFKNNFFLNCDLSTSFLKISQNSSFGKTLYLKNNPLVLIMEKLNISEQEIPKVSTKPYLKYFDSEANTIREYNLFQKLSPQVVDYKNRKNYFLKQDLKKQYELLGGYKLKWGGGQENIGVIEYQNNSRTVKKKYGWIVSKANYNLILTNQPYNPPELMTQNEFGENNFFNRSICYLDNESPHTLNDFLNYYCNETDLSPYLEKMLYWRLMTKNLKLKFDWSSLIYDLFNVYFKEVCQSPLLPNKNLEYYFLKLKDNHEQMYSDLLQKRKIILWNLNKETIKF
ncbi:putative membrane protein [Candidatus Phytoplasma solani]|uniref:hypothetical protein n=1 Tax=Candidatus Phytoplasma solani TaxID=69896 RepID=UPI0032D9DBF0